MRCLLICTRAGTQGLEYHFVLCFRRSVKPVWSQVFKDFSGAGNVTAVSKPFYALNGQNEASGPMLGVIGHNVHLEEFDGHEKSPEEIVEELAADSNGCQKIDLDGCQLQVRCKATEQVLTQRN